MKGFSTSLGVLAAAAIVSPVSASSNSSGDSNPTLALSSDSSFNFNLLIILGDAIAGGADIGPVLGAAKNLIPGDMESYSDEFYKVANLTISQAEAKGIDYDPVNLRDTWFSASNYFRRADFYLHGNWSDPRINSYWEAQTVAFNKGIAALPVPGKRVQLPAKKGNFTVEAIWYGASGSKDKKAPTLIVGNGYDAAQEDSYHNYCAPALARGWNCITYEGPGQPTVRRNQNLGFIPQWENVVSPVVDYLAEKQSNAVNMDQLALLGNSMGGYLALRAAAFEPRISAAVAIDGVWDLYKAFSGEFTDELLAVYEAGNFSSFDEQVIAMRQSGKFPTTLAWGIDQGLWSFITHSPSALLTQSKNYRLENVVDKIKMPVFVGNGEFDTMVPGQAPHVAEALGPKATLHNFTGVAGYHCQTASQQEVSRVIFAWMNETMS